MTLQSLPECNGELTAGITLINNVSQLAFEILYSHSLIYIVVCLLTPSISLCVCSPHP